jgi:hypothetical protein
MNRLRGRSRSDIGSGRGRKSEDEVGYYHFFAARSAISTEQLSRRNNALLYLKYDILPAYSVLAPLRRFPAAMAVDPVPYQVYTREFSF